MQLYRVWPILEKLEIVKPSRKIGATVLFKANIESPIFKKLSELSLEIASKTLLGFTLLSRLIFSSLQSMDDNEFLDAPH